jgi:ribosomal protein L32
MLAPKKKTSKSRTNRRTTAWMKLNAKRLTDMMQLQRDADGKAIALAHFASPVTGEYRGRKVYDVSKASKVKTVRA